MREAFYMQKYVMALDAGTTSNRAFYSMKKVKCAVWHRENFISIFRNPAG